MEEDHAIIAYKDGRYYGFEEFGSESWYREVLAPGGVDVLVTSRFFWVRKMKGASAFTSGFGYWRIILHVPDSMRDVWMYEIENYELSEYLSGYAVTYREAARDILAVVQRKGDNNAA